MKCLLSWLLWHHTLFPTCVLSWPFLCQSLVAPGLLLFYDLHFLLRDLIQFYDFNIMYMLQHPHLYFQHEHHPTQIQTCTSNYLSWLTLYVSKYLKIKTPPIHPHYYRCFLIPSYHHLLLELMSNYLAKHTASMSGPYKHHSKSTEISLKVHQVMSVLR